MRLLGPLAALALTSAAGAVVISSADPMAAPDNGFVGDWNGSSAVCIAPNWIISARHVGGQVGDLFTMRGREYRAVEIRTHPVQDIELIRVAETLPGHHALASDTRPGDIGVLGGWGVTAGEPLIGGNGFAWSASRAETWGVNTIDSIGSLLTIRFDRPSSSASVPHEAIFAVNDSGGGLFTHGATGELELAGIAVSVSGFGQSSYGASANCLNIERLRAWIAPIALPGAPITSSVEAPRE